MQILICCGEILCGSSMPQMLWQEPPRLDCNFDPSRYGVLDVISLWQTLPDNLRDASKRPTHHSNDTRRKLVPNSTEEGKQCFPRSSSRLALEAHSSFLGYFFLHEIP